RPVLGVAPAGHRRRGGFPVVAPGLRVRPPVLAGHSVRARHPRALVLGGCRPPVPAAHEIAGGAAPHHGPPDPARGGGGLPTASPGGPRGCLSLDRSHALRSGILPPARALELSRGS